MPISLLNRKSAVAPIKADKRLSPAIPRTEGMHTFKPCSFFWILEPGTKPVRKTIGVDATPEGMRFTEATLTPATVLYSLHAIEELRDRCAPWVTVFAGPGLESFNTTAHLGEWSQSLGTAFNAGYMALKIWRSTDDFTNTVHHEIWHFIERELSESSLAEIDKWLLDGPTYTGTDYIGYIEERRARTYSHFARIWDEDFPIPITNNAISIFRDVYDGGFAKRLMSTLNEQVAA